MGFYSRLFLVPKKGDSFRPVIDLSHLNKFIANEHFQMENLTCIKHLLNVNEYIVKLDLKDAYLTVGVHPESQKFLRFVWLGQTYQFLALPFGLNTAPRIFTKLLKPVVAYLRTRNIRLLIYLDDILIIGSSVQILREHTALVIELLQNLGFIINYERSLLTPTPVLEFLGFLINSKTMKFYLPQTKVAKVLDLCKSLLKENPISLHLLAQLQGFLESCRPAVWLAPLHFRHLQSCLIRQVALNKGSYQGTVLLDPQAREELQWWITNIKRVNGSPIHPPATEMVITSDASKMGWGATFGNLSTNGRWSKQESGLHINVLELKATFLAIQAFLKNQSNLAVKLRLDNTTAVTYVNNQGGTRSPSLTLLTVELWNWCLQRNIPITAEHLPGVFNVLADRVADIYRFQRLETTTGNNTIFPQGQRDRSLRHKTDQSIKELCELATRPTCCGDGRFFNRLESDERICVPTIQSHPTDINEGYKRQCEHSASSTSVANSTLVATTATAHSPTSNTSSRIPNSSTRPVQSQGNPSNVPETETSRLDYFQQLCTIAGLSNTVTRLLSSATRQSTNKSYDCAWTKWNGRCNRRKVNPISAIVKDILTFLSDQFDNNLQYRTVNVLRSAISSIHPWIEGKPVGQHPLVIRLMKGIANERPPKPRYTTTWDVAKVTTYLSALGENKTLSLKLLTKKLLMLLALVSPERATFLWELNIRYLKKQPDGVVFTVIKPRKSGDPMSRAKATFPRFLQDTTICPCDCLETYLKATEKFRLSEDSNKLFLSFQRPHDPVAKATVTRWLCDVLIAAGIDSTIFKAHSTRAASTSAAAKKHLPLV